MSPVNLLRSSPRFRDRLRSTAPSGDIIRPTPAHACQLRLAAAPPTRPTPARRADTCPPDISAPLRPDTCRQGPFRPDARQMWPTAAGTWLTRSAGSGAPCCALQEDLRQSTQFVAYGFSASRCSQYAVYSPGIGKRAGRAAAGAHPAHVSLLPGVKKFFVIGRYTEYSYYTESSQHNDSR